MPTVEAEELWGLMKQEEIAFSEAELSSLFLLWYHAGGKHCKEMETLSVNIHNVLVLKILY